MSNSPHPRITNIFPNHMFIFQILDAADITDIPFPYPAKPIAFPIILIELS